MLCSKPQSFWLMAAGVPLAVFLAWAEIRLPSLVVAEVTGGQTFAHAAAAVALLLGAMLAATALKDFFSTVLGAYVNRYRFRQDVLLSQKSMHCFYQTYEKKETRDLFKRAQAATWMSNGVVKLIEVPQTSMQLVQSILCYILFGTVISFVSPWLVLFLTAAPLVNWFCARAYQRYEYQTRAERTDISRKLDYITGRTADFAAAKDIRIYCMSDWLKTIYRDLLNKHIAWERRLNLRQFASRLPDLGIILLRDGAAYAILIAMALRGAITVEQFVLYFAAVSGFAGHIADIVRAWGDLHAASLVISDFREYLDLPDRDGTGTAHAEALCGHAPEIILDHVSFRYDGAEQNTLDDICLTFHPGERIALVGMNGAGKTTLVKLLCGLYEPSSGEIRVDGIPAADFLRADYYRLFSPVFQTVQTAFFSLAETVAGAFGDQVDRTRAEACMRRAGLGSKLDALPNGVNTHLDNQVHADGIELSGGEAQKLMMARALYKNAPVLVLDEPTAALDPIAENNIYLAYRDMTAGKTSLFISHRLASTRFCDRILFLADGKIIEEGTHEALIAQGGAYAKLYEIQSCWYRDDYSPEHDAETSKGGAQA